MVTGLQAPMVAGVVSPFAKVVQSPFTGNGFTPSIIARAIGILRSFGANASEYPFSTLQGAYQTSAGPAAAAVNDPIGLELDAMGMVGPELVTNGDFSNGATGWTLTGGTSISGGSANYTLETNYISLYQNCGLQAGKTYKLTFDCVVSAGAVGPLLNGGANIAGDTKTTSGTYSWYLSNPVSNGIFSINVQGFTGSVGNISCVQVTGNHATQTTAGSRPLLAQDAGGRWYASMTGGKSIAATFPAGYESATTIDSTSAGQVTLTGQNLVGTYTINTDTYDRIVIRDSASVSAAQLVILQRYSNLLAGL